MPERTPPQLIEQRFMSQVVDVLYMVVCLVLPLCFLLRLTRMYSFQNAKPPATYSKGSKGFLGRLQA